MAKTMPAPDLRELGDFALAAGRNARRLLADADLLLAHGRWPSAYSLAVLAFEEAGKAWMCITAMTVPDDIRPEWPHAESTARHADKLLAAHVMAHMFACAASGRDMIDGLAAVGEHLEELAREHNQAKQRGFYADLLDGIVREPGTVTKAEAKRMVATVRGLLEDGGILADHGFIAWLVGEEPDALQVFISVVPSRSGLTAILRSQNEARYTQHYCTSRMPGGGAAERHRRFGGPVTGQAVGGLARGGRAVVMGYAAGTETTMSVTDLVWKLAHVSGFSLFAASAGEQAEAYATVLPLIASGQITPARDRSFPLGQAPEALRHLIEDRPFGKVTLAVDALARCARPADAKSRHAGTCVRR